MAGINIILPYFASLVLSRSFQSSTQQYLLVKSFSLLGLGMFLSTLATLNFSLAFLIGLLSTPLSFVSVPQSSSSSSISSSSITTSTNNEAQNPVSTVPSSVKGISGSKSELSDPNKKRQGRRLVTTLSTIVLLHLLSPTIILSFFAYYVDLPLGQLLVRAAFGWHVWRMWTPVVVWCVWWPAWFIGQVLLASSLLFSA